MGIKNDLEVNYRILKNIYEFLEILGMIWFEMMFF